MTVQINLVFADGFLANSQTAAQTHGTKRIAGETITPTGSSQASSVIVSSRYVSGAVWEIDNDDAGELWVRFYQSDTSPAPEASAGNDFRVKVSERRYFTAKPGETVAIING